VNFVNRAGRVQEIGFSRAWRSTNNRNPANNAVRTKDNRAASWASRISKMADTNTGQISY
jgi:hypothetical protein